MHVLAVSGLHVGLILQILLGVAKLFSRLITKKIAVILIVLLLWIYALITGFSQALFERFLCFQH
jgi:Competence protein.